MTRFRDTHICAQSRHFVFTATNQALSASDPCPGLSPDSLVQQEQEYVSDPSENRVAHLPQKPKNINFSDSIITIVDTACQPSAHADYELPKGDFPLPQRVLSAW